MNKSCKELFKITDLLFYLTDYLDDFSSFQLFITNKFTYNLIINHSHRYKIKKLISDTYLFHNNLYKFKIQRFYISKSISNYYLPLYLTHLTFNNNFNYTVTNLPYTLTHIYFGHKFNQFVDSLPPNLTHVIFGWAFNKNIDLLPAKITYLKFGLCFNQSLKKLPLLLKTIVLSCCYKKSIDCIPGNVIILLF